jgi:ribosomal protein S18 acetylase RimI-like enzyme
MHIIDVVVRSAFRTCGIGKMLVEKTEAWAAAEGAASIELNVYEFNEGAISFYERLGYQAISRRMSKALE